MSDMNELYAAYRHKKTLEQQLEVLKNDEKIAKQLVDDCRIRCQQENLDVQKLEGHEFKKFWLKLRGELEKQQLENNAKTRARMQELHDAQEKAYDIAVEKRGLELELGKLDGVEQAYEEALKRQLDHLDYSVYRDDIIHMQDKIKNDAYQLTVLNQSKDYAELAKRKAASLVQLLKEVTDYIQGLNKEDTEGRSNIRVMIQECITATSELRVQLHRLDQNLAEIDAMEAEEFSFSGKLSIHIPALFYSEDLRAELHETEIAKAKKELLDIQTGIGLAEQSLDMLAGEIQETKRHHQIQLEEFVKNSADVLS